MAGKALQQDRRLDSWCLMVGVEVTGPAANQATRPYYSREGASIYRGSGRVCPELV
jgi:hypothetical protein